VPFTIFLATRLIDIRITIRLCVCACCGDSLHYKKRARNSSGAGGEKASMKTCNYRSIPGSADNNSFLHPLPCIGSAFGISVVALAHATCSGDWWIIYKFGVALCRAHATDRWMMSTRYCRHGLPDIGFCIIMAPAGTIRVLLDGVYSCMQGLQFDISVLIFEVGEEEKKLVCYPWATHVIGQEVVNLNTGTLRVP